MEHITIDVRIEPGVFRRYAIFDTFIRQKRWRGLALFAGITLASACFCFLSGSSITLGIALTVLGVGLPSVFLGVFLRSVGKKIKEQGLPKPTYSLDMTDAGIEVRSLSGTDEVASLKWENIHSAYRDKGCIYLYAFEGRAFLLPDGQANAPADKVWEFIEKHIHPDRRSTLT